MALSFEEIAKIENEEEKVNEIYNVFNEDTRLNYSKAARVEFITTTRYIDMYLKEGARILDVGAGAGEYSIHYASKGYDVTAVELTDANIAAFKKKITPDMKLTLRQGNALDLSAFPEESFDVVLLMGPLYHLKNDEDKLKAIAEAKRVCKKGGIIFFAFITNDFVVLTELSYSLNFFKGDTYNHDTFRLVDEPFVFATVDKARAIMREADISVQKEVAVDGPTELIQNMIDQLDEESYQQYLRYHFYICEKKELLGMTNHLLMIGR